MTTISAQRGSIRKAASIRNTRTMTSVALLAAVSFAFGNAPSSYFCSNGNIVHIPVFPQSLFIFFLTIFALC